MPATRKKPQSGGLSPAHTIDLNAAGVDIGATEIYIAVPANRDPHPVRRFATFTAFGSAISSAGQRTASVPTSTFARSNNFSGGGKKSLVSVGSSLWILT